MNSDRIAEIKNELETVGMLPAEGDDTYTWDVCECCKETTDTQTWEGVTVIVTICPACLSKIEEN